MRKAGCFNYKHWDVWWMMASIRFVICALRLTFDKLRTPPILHFRKHKVENDKVIVVHEIYYDPYDLIINHTEWLSQPEINAIVCKIINNHYQKKCTKQKNLINELNKENSKLQLQLFKMENACTWAHILVELTWCVKHSPPEFQLYWTSVNSYYLLFLCFSV